MKLSSFEKRVKRRIVGPGHTFFAVCPPGLEAVLKAELLAAGIAPKNIRTFHGGAEFDARLALAIELNLMLRSASRIIMRLETFKADSFGKLEKKFNAIDWILYLPQNCPIQFKVTTKKSRLYHSDAIAQRCEAIVSSHIGQSSSARLKNDTKAADPYLQTIFIRADHDQFTISLDTSGELLFKRGIKKQVTQAPLRETLAYAMLFWAGFKQTDILMDPMCGSGTFSIEAAMIQSNLCPGYFRSFAFETWPAFSPKALAHLKKEVKKHQIMPAEKLIFASDDDEDAIAALRHNIAGRHFEQMINVAQKDFFSLIPSDLSKTLTGSQSQNRVLMLNPPYGKRLGQKSATPAFFHEIAKKLKADFKGWRTGIILPDKACASALGLPLSFRPIFHGGLELFAGTGVIN